MFGIILSILITAQAGPKLKEILAKGKAGTYPVIIYMNETLSEDKLVPLINGKSKELRRKIVVQKLKEFAEKSQKGLLSYLESQKNVKDIKPIWIANAIYAKLDIEIIKELLKRDDIWGIEIDEPQKAILKDTKKGSKITLKSLPPAPDTAWGVEFINASAAWDQGYKGNGIIVGVFDTGVNYNHNDLKNRIWRNEAEYNGIEGVDDDGNGYVDDYMGWDFANWDNDPMDDLRDMWGNPIYHGSHVAGTIAGDGTGGLLTGVAPEATIMPLKVLNSVGYGAEGWVWLAIEYGIENGCDVMSFSIGWMNDWTLDRSRWRYVSKMARLAGVIMSCAAGNNGNDSPNNNIVNPGSSPPPWLHPDQIATGNVGSLSGVITVGAIDQAGDTAGFSSVGPSYWSDVYPWNDFPLPEGLIDPDIAAPGVYVPSIAGETNDGYRLMSGTSMATPHISGVLALLLSKNPELTPREADSILETTATDWGPTGKDNSTGAGIVNVPSAITATPLPQYHLVITGDSVSDQNGNGLIEPGENVSYFLKVKNVGTSSITGVNAYLSTYSPYVNITTNSVNAGDFASSQEKWVGPFQFTVSNDVPNEKRAVFDAEFYGNSGNYYAKRFAVVVLNPYLPTDVYGPDDYGYYAYESNDPDANSPTYSWVDVSLQPGAVNHAELGDDDAIYVPLPFTFRYYGMPIDYIIIGNNGHLMVAVNTSYSPYMNKPLPYHDAYPMIAPLWADFDSSGNVFSWYDSTNHRFFVSWEDVTHWGLTTLEKFEVILYDPAYCPTPTGDGEIVFKYARAPATGDNTEFWNIGSVIGIESPYENTGITTWYADAPRPGFHDPTASYAIKFTTKQPSPFLSSTEDTKMKKKFSFIPLMNTNEILLTLPQIEKGILEIYNSAGRKVKILKKGIFASENRFKIPSELPKGVYFIKLETDKRTETKKIIISK